MLAVLWNLLLAYVVYQIARLTYYFENTDYLNYTLDVWRGGLLFDTSAILYTNALYIVLMLLPLHWKECTIYHQCCKWIFVLVNSLALAINLIDSVYFLYTMRRTTTTVLEEFSNEGNLGSIIGTEFLNHWYLVLLFALVVFLLWRCYARPSINSHSLKWWRYDVVCLLSLLLFAPFCVAGMRGGFTTAVRPITISNANQYASRPVDAALALNTPFALIRSIGKNVFVVPNYFSDEKALASIYTPVHTPNDSVSMVKKNVVVLIVESFGREYIGALNKDLEGGKYKGYTPYVDALIDKSTTFRYSFCSFQHYFGRTEYEAAKGTNDFDGTWAIWDEPFLQYYAEEMGKMKQPFMTAVFTASSHHPFVIPEQYKEQFPEGKLEIQKCIRYTDMAIGKFFETASKQPWFENTIFVLTSDHTNGSDHDYYQTDLGGFCSPIIIFEPSHPKGQMIDKIAQQIDILPTILGMLGYQKPYFGFGIDLLNTPSEDTWAVNYLSGIYQYIKHGYVLQFDGQKTKAVYSLQDSLMQNNLVGKVKEQGQMEQELKAIIQQYMERMTQNRLKP